MGPEERRSYIKKPSLLITTHETTMNTANCAIRSRRQTYTRITIHRPHIPNPCQCAMTAKLVYHTPRPLHPAQPLRHNTAASPMQTTATGPQAAHRISPHALALRRHPR